jgi:nitrile hydratase
VEELLVEKGVFTHEEVRAQIEFTEARTYENGARLVAKAWTDPEFKAKLLSDPKGAAAEIGVDASGPVEISVVENTPRTHN